MIRNRHAHIHKLVVMLVNDILKAVYHGMHQMFVNKQGDMIYCTATKVLTMHVVTGKHKKHVINKVKKRSEQGKDLQTWSEHGLDSASLKP